MITNIIIFIVGICIGALYSWTKSENYYAQKQFTYVKELSEKYDFTIKEVNEIIND